MIRRILRTYPLSCIALLLIWIACLIPVPSTPLDDVQLIDKWTHLVLFGGLSFLICVESGRACRLRSIGRLLFKTALIPWLTGGLIELAQAYCTNGMRSGDWFDFWADGIGVLLGFSVGILPALYLSRRNKD